MEIVINISDKDYQLMKDGHIPFNVLDAIRNGTPLPKGHGRIKDVSKLSYRCMKEDGSSCNHKNCSICQFMCVAKYEVDDTLIIIEADKGE